jgi:hypothetical protein
MSGEFAGARAADTEPGSGPMFGEMGGDEEM